MLGIVLILARFFPSVASPVSQRLINAVLFPVVATFAGEHRNRNRFPDNTRLTLVARSPANSCGLLGVSHERDRRA